MRRLLAFAVTIFILIAVGCQNSHRCAGPTQTLQNGIILWDGTGGIFWPTDEAAIQEVDLTGDLLRLEIMYSGGCRRHDFELYGSTSFMESYPAQTIVCLSHDAHGDPCKAIIAKELHFDLSPLKQAYQYIYRREKDSFYMWIYEPGASEPLEYSLLYEF